MELRVWDCPSCGAPLPPAGLDSDVTCTSCGKQTTIADGSDAIVREKQSRAEAEAIFEKLGRPPRWSQRVAAGLASWKVWVLGFPFALGLLWTIGEKPRNWFEAIWEHLFHERLEHVVSPAKAFLLHDGFQVAVAVGLLVWSLLGERVDARRDLQAMLAAKPPETEGGPARCRQCSAPLDVTPGALGARCPYCGADNLVVLPPEWIAKAKSMASELRLTVDLARKRAAVGRRRMIVAAAWRVPLVLLLLYMVTSSAASVRGYATWDDMRVSLHGGGPPEIGLYAIANAKEDRLRPYGRCADRKHLKDSAFDTKSANGCDNLGCSTYTTFALRHGDTLHLVRTTPGSVGVRIALGVNFPFAGQPVASETGDDIFDGNLPDDEIVQHIAISGWYQVSLFARTQDAAIGVVPCVQ